MTATEKFAKRLERCIKSAPEGCLIYCMDGTMLVAPPDAAEEINDRDGDMYNWAHDPVTNQDRLVIAGQIRDCGGW